MIFPELARLVLFGQKTETRRPVEEDKPCRYRPWRTYTVQPGRGEACIGRLRVRAVRRERLRQIDDDGVRREGFADRAAFLDYWRDLYGRVDEAQEVE